MRKIPMVKFNSRIILSLLLLLAFFSFAHAGEKAKEETKIDLKMTTDYFKQWEGREKFPDSVTFSYYYAYSLSALNEKITPEIKAKIVDFITRCQAKNGGFTSEPTYSKDSNIIFTYYALKSLAFLDSFDAINKEKVQDFVLGLYKSDGGFTAQDKKGQNTSLAMTSYGVECLQMLGALDKLDKQKTIQFIKGNMSKDGKSFSMVPKGGASPQAANMAAKSLDLLGGLTASAKSSVVEYLKGTRYSGHIVDKKYQSLPKLKKMANTIETFVSLSALDQANTAKMLEFVESLYIPENGGFGPQPGLGSTPPSTYYGIVCLAGLGKLPSQMPPPQTSK